MSWVQLSKPLTVEISFPNDNKERHHVVTLLAYRFEGEHLEYLSVNGHTIRATWILRVH